MRTKSHSSALLAAAVMLTFAAGTATAGQPERGQGGSCTTVNGGGTSSWVLCDDEITDNGLPVGGVCATAAPGAGASIDDASLATPASSDAFDFASLLFVNNSQVGGVRALTGNSVSFAPSTVGGLTRNMRYDVLTTEATLRVVFTLTNTTGAPITTPVNYVGNFGSDGGTVINGSFTGDTLFTTADEWIVTSDGSNGDPVNTSVFFGGTSTPPVTPTSVSLVAFDCAATPGYNVLFNPTIPANSSITFLFFQRLSDTAALAVPAAQDFTNITSASPLLAGVSAAELGRLANFAFAPVGPVAPPPPIPALSPRLMVLLGVVLALFGLVAVRTTQSRG